MVARRRTLAAATAFDELFQLLWLDESETLLIVKILNGTSQNKGKKTVKHSQRLGNRSCCELDKEL